MKYVYAVIVVAVVAFFGYREYLILTIPEPVRVIMLHLNNEEEEPYISIRKSGFRLGDPSQTIDTALINPREKTINITREVQYLYVDGSQTMTVDYIFNCKNSVGGIFPCNAKAVVTGFENNNLR